MSRYSNTFKTKTKTVKYKTKQLSIMTPIIKEMNEKSFKVLFTNLDYLRLNAESYDSDKLLDFTKALAYKLMEAMSNDIEYKNGDENSKEYLDYSNNFDDNFSQSEADRNEMDEFFSETIN